MRRRGDGLCEQENSRTVWVTGKGWDGLGLEKKSRKNRVNRRREG